MKLVKEHINEISLEGSHLNRMNVGEKARIIRWLDEMQVTKYIINDDLSVSVDGDVDLDLCELKHIPIKFKNVYGYFWCDDNKLTTLEGCPKYVEKTFTCDRNNLTSLKGCPVLIGKNFSCEDNILESLEGCPEHVGGNFSIAGWGKEFSESEIRNICKVGGRISVSHHNPLPVGDFIVNEVSLSGSHLDRMNVGERARIKRWLDEMAIENYTINDDLSVDVDGYVDIDSKNLISIPINFRNVSGIFWCGHNQLTSLKGCPKIVGGDFYCDDNQLTSLKGCPKKVEGAFWCSYNLLDSLEGCPKIVPKDFFCNDNQLTSLKGCPKSVGGSLWCDYNKKKFTVEEVKIYCDVTNEIHCNIDDYTG
jgi:hypothetical protein